jgi:hypothetical protein
MALPPYNSSMYTLTVLGPSGGSATCNTTVQTQAYYPPPPTTPTVRLSQIPYTGFDFGTLGDALYTLLICGSALSAGYLLMYYTLLHRRFALR